MKKELMRDTLNWGRTSAPSPDDTEDEEYEGPDQHLDELLMLLSEEKDTNTPLAHTIINSIVTSPPPPSPARKTRSCSVTKLESSVMGQWLARGRGEDAGSVPAAKNTNDVQASTNTITAKSTTKLGPTKSVHTPIFPKTPTHVSYHSIPQAAQPGLAGGVQLGAWSTQKDFTSPHTHTKFTAEMASKNAPLKQPKITSFLPPPSSATCTTSRCRSSHHAS